MTGTIIHNDDEREAVIDDLREQPYPVWVEYSRRRLRSKMQNNLMWKWAREIADQTGYTKEEVEARWKGQYGIPILSRDSEEHRCLYARIPWKDGDKEEIYRMLAFLPVTREMTEAQMTEFLNLVQEYHIRMGHYLTDPEDDLTTQHQKPYDESESS